jgi:hypothetical protein
MAKKRKERRSGKEKKRKLGLHHILASYTEEKNKKTKKTKKVLEEIEPRSSSPNTLPVDHKPLGESWVKSTRLSF